MHAIDLFDRYHLKVDDFHKMGEVGIIPPDSRVELIDGEIINMAPIGSGHHAGTLDYLVSVIGKKLSANATLRVQNPIILGADSEVQPDLAIVKTSEDFYRSAHPKEQDALLLIEISDTTLKFDREIKIPLYAKHNIKELWLINLVDKRLEIYRTPNINKHLFQDIKILTEGSISALLANFNLNIDELFK
jgi:Uma2 family endonuclease